MKTRRLAGFAIIVVCEWLSLTSSFGQVMTGKQILERMYATYASAKTYQDVGTVQRRGVKKDKTLLDCITPEVKLAAINFGTAFVREKQQFKFHFDLDKKPYSCYTIAAFGKQVKSWWTYRPKKKAYDEESLISSLGAAVGISGTSSGKISSLLLNKEISQNWTIRQVTNWRLIKNVMQDNRTCYLLEGFVTNGNKASRRDEKVNIYVDTQTFLVLRIDDQPDMGDIVYFSTITYKPLINKVVPEKAVAIVDVCAEK
ncbi:hypothetical protein ACFSUS_15405 [Spirosoma soli]|uniref:DUF3108 domain-containing protein n=2 Tax=Spirosoma soli TaxID=1770529 RepID=A0ABW5M4X1_9BACT